MMLLIVVSNLNFGTQCETSGIRFYDLIEDLQQSRFAGSVVSDDGNMFASFDLKTDISKQHLTVKLFSQ